MPFLPTLQNHTPNPMAYLVNFLNALFDENFTVAYVIAAYINMLTMLALIPCLRTYLVTLLVTFGFYTIGIYTYLWVVLQKRAIHRRLREKYSQYEGELTKKEFAAGGTGLLDFNEAENALHRTEPASI